MTIKAQTDSEQSECQMDAFCRRPEGHTDQHSPTQGYSYTINVQIRVAGPDMDWDEVANALADRIRGMRSKGGFAVASVEIDRGV